MDVVYSCASSSESRCFVWCGQKWFVKHSPGEKVGPGPSTFHFRNVELGTDNSLRLWVRDVCAIEDAKSCSYSSAEIQTVAAVGYGLFQVDVHGTLTGPRWNNLVFGFFTYDLDNADEQNKEIDIEIGTFNGNHSTGGAFSIQNDRDKQMGIHPAEKSAIHQLSIEWRPESITWSIVNLEETIVLDTLRSGRKVPKCDGASFLMNLWQFQNVIPNGTDQSIVLRNFKYTPMREMHPPKLKFIDAVSFKDKDNHFVRGITHRHKEISLKARRRMTNVKVSIGTSENGVTAEYTGNNEHSCLNCGLEIKGGSTDFATINLTFYDVRQNFLQVRVECDQLEFPFLSSLPIHISNEQMP